MSKNSAALGRFNADIAEQNAIGLFSATTDSPAQLMQLRHSKAFGMFNEHDSRAIGHVLRKYSLLVALPIHVVSLATLTLHCLGLHEDLRRSLSTTNLLERIMAQIERKTQRVDHWRTSDQKQRWCAATLLQIEQNFRRVRGCKHLAFFQTALTNKLHLAAA